MGYLDMFIIHKVEGSMLFISAHQNDVVSPFLSNIKYYHFINALSYLSP